MDNFFLLVSSIFALAALVFIAEPYRFLPEQNGKKIRVGSTYWGFYTGTPEKEPEKLRTIEVKKPARTTQYVVGSQTYSKGRGVNISGRG